MKLSVILPTYCEAGNVNKLIKALIKHLKLPNHKLQIVVVDDDSPDGTAQEVQKLVEQNLPVKLLVRKNQRGLATAIAHGIKKSQGDIIVLMDVDFNHKPQDVPRLLLPILGGKSDLVIGSRYIPGGGMDVTEAGRIQFFLSKNGNFFVNKILLNLPVHESLSGFVAFKREILNNLDTDSIFQGYGEYCIRLLYRVYQQGHKVSGVPVVYGGRQWGQSKSRLMKMTVNYLKTALLFRLGR